jgi:hypothetical protein
MDHHYHARRFITVPTTLHGKIAQQYFYFYARPSSEGHIFVFKGSSR